MKQALSVMYDDYLLPVKWLNAARAQSRPVEVITMEILLVNSDKAKEQKLLADASNRLEDMEKLINDYSITPIGMQQKTDMADIKSMIVFYKAERQKAIDLAMRGNKQDGYAYFVINAAGHINHINSVLEELAHKAEKQAASLNEHSAAQAAAAVTKMIGITLSAVLVSLSLGLVTARAIAKPLREMVGRVQEMAGGNLTGKDIEITVHDEVGQLAKAFNDMAGNLRNLIQYQPSRVKLTYWR